MISRRSGTLGCVRRLSVRITIQWSVPGNGLTRPATTSGLLDVAWRSRLWTDSQGRSDSLTRARRAQGAVSGATREPHVGRIGNQVTYPVAAGGAVAQVLADHPRRAGQQALAPGRSSSTAAPPMPAKRAGAGAAGRGAPARPARIGALTTGRSPTRSSAQRRRDEQSGRQRRRSRATASRVKRPRRCRRPLRSTDHSRAGTASALQG